MKSENNPNAVGVETAVKTLVSEKLDKIMQGAKTASEAVGVDGNDLLGNVATQSQGGVAGNVDKLVEGIKGMVEVVLKGKGNPEAGDNKKAENLSARSKDGAVKLFGNDSASTDGQKAAADAAKAVGAVTGADILQAMIKNSGDAAKLANNSIAASSISVTAPKDAEVAGGIVLRALAKSGKFANGSTDATAEIKGVAISSVIKALDTLTIAVRKTIDEGLKSIKEAMKMNPETIPVTTEAKNQ